MGWGAAAGARLGSFFCLAIHANRYGTIVDERHFHIGTKRACLHFLAQLARQFVAEVLVERDGCLMFGGAKPRRTVALFVACKECKLRNDEHFALNILYGAVHNTLLIIEDA